MNLVLGCIADDITGATDIGLMLSRHGMPTTLQLGVPASPRPVTTPAVVIALKIRTVAAADAVAAAVSAADWLLLQKPQQLYYKYCSTFDSTAKGNIGPVVDALLDRLGEAFTVLVPAFPDNGRTVQDGQLLVNGAPLSQSSMRNHPLTPMTESALTVLMDRQTAAGRTGHVSLSTVEAGPDALTAAFDDLCQRGFHYAAPDAIDERHLQIIGTASKALRLLTGGSGLAAALPDLYRQEQYLQADSQPSPLPVLPGHAAILAGSCSTATRKQVAAFARHTNPIVVDPLAIAADDAAEDRLLQLACEAIERGPVLVHSAADQLQQAHAGLGVAASAEIVERVLAKVAAGLASNGIRKFIVAGGETSGAIAAALSIDTLRIGPAVDHGVPWMVADQPQEMCLAFKSGNFGGEDFFDRALAMLP